MQSLQKIQTVTHALKNIDPDLYLTMKNSLYPGAKDESISLVVSYCNAAKLDPMLKPVHIVPMSVKDSKTGKYEWRDIIMPGINLYRIQAARSGCAGISEPEFGDDITYTWEKTEKTPRKTVTYPRWCKVTVKKIIDGKLFEFSAKEFWTENYATSGKDSDAPNSMWTKRPYGQLAKCAQAQALRTGFPEICSLPTAEEMEGKNITYESELIHSAPNPEKGINGLKSKILSTIEESSLAEDISDLVEDINSEEITEEGAVTVDEVKRSIMAANNVEELITAMDASKFLPQDKQAEIQGAYKWKEKKLAEAA